MSEPTAPSTDSPNPSSDVPIASSEGDVSPGSNSPSGPYASIVGPDGSFVEGWADSLPEDIRPFATSAAKYRTLPEFIKGHGNLASKLGANTVKVPGPDSDEAAITEFRIATGVPDAPQNYGLDKAPEGWPEQFEYNQERATELAQVLHEGNVPAEVATKLSALEAKWMQAEIDQSARAQSEYDASNEAALKEAWGADYDVQKQAAYKAALAFGFDMSDPDASPAAEAIAWAKVHKALSEDDTAQRAAGLDPGKLDLMTGNPGLEANRIMTDPNHRDNAAYLRNDPHVRARVHDLLRRAEQMKGGAAA